MPRALGLILPLAALVLAGCGTTKRYDGHTYQDVFLAARHVMDRYAAENVVGAEQGYVDWEDHDDSLANTAVAFTSLGGFAHVKDHIRIEVEPIGKRQVEVTVTAGDDYLAAWLPVRVPRGGLEKEIQEKILARLEEMVGAQVREEEDRELRAIGARVEYKPENLAASERAGYGFGRVEEADLDRFSRGQSDVDRHYEEIPDAPRGDRRPPPDPGTGGLDEPDPTGDRTASVDEPRLPTDEPRRPAGVGEPLPGGHARHAFEPFKEQGPERPAGPTPSGMVLVPGGEFAMGWSGGEPDEQPEQTIYVSSFYIDITEVTNGEYRRFFESISRDHDHARCHPDEPPGRTHRPRYWGREGLADYEAPELPVVGVDWFDAYAYAAWAGKRLPTEAEWEKAARGTDGRRYPWGNAFESRAVNCALSGLQRPSPVNRREAGASPYGALDMAGNVSEWCLDQYGEGFYREMPGRDPLNDRESLGRVLRGGSWKDPRDLVRSTFRNYGRADRYALYIGFRCARDPE